jgi:hypothetical protein
MLSPSRVAWTGTRKARLAPGPYLARVDQAVTPQWSDSRKPLLATAPAAAESGPTDEMFGAPADPRTADYVNGRFG